ncbi:MAG: molecular chaperone HtpG [Lachnospiraceae bacterium]
MNKEGSLSINSENIFPIIKKWLYSDHDIFFRELVSNGCDAVTKLKKLDMIGEYTIPEGKELCVKVTADAETKTITFTDNGIGMDANEIDQYINQIAFSGARDFLDKYKDKTNDDQIIGHFGLGFYSAFMVADRVTIDSLSYKEGAKAVHWESDEGTSFEMTDSAKTEIGTTITLYLNEDSYEFCNEYRAKEILDKYCSFMPIPIYFEAIKTAEEQARIDEAEKKAKEEEEKRKAEEAAKKAADGEAVEAETEAEPAEKAPEAPKPINETTPLWAKHPNECTDEEYKEFYHRVFHDYKEPLFWIHLNMDYPFNLKGILYFPKINTEYDSIEGTIKLYNNQVFVADNIKEVIPEFLMLLKGVIDCPDLPLNVSRSALQNDGFVKKISDYITKKVADRLTGMCKTKREDYEKFWDDINPFIKFGVLKDEKFAEKMNDYIIFKDLNGKYLTLPDILKENEEKHKNQVFYVTDEKEQSQYIEMFKKEGINAVLLKHNIDAPFITRLEQKNPDVKFVRIDSDLTDSFKEETSDEEKETLKKDSESLTALFHKALNNDKLTVKAEKLKDASMACVMTLSEEGRRMQEMMKMYGMSGMDLVHQMKHLS